MILVPTHTPPLDTATGTTRSCEHLVDIKKKAIFINSPLTDLNASLTPVRKTESSTLKLPICSPNGVQNVLPTFG